MLFNLKHWHLCVFIINKSYSVKHMQTQTKILHCHISFKRTLITEHKKNRTHAQNYTKLSWSWYLYDNVCFAAKHSVSITNGINSLQPDCTRAAHTLTQATQLLFWSLKHVGTPPRLLELECLWRIHNMPKTFPKQLQTSHLLQDWGSLRKSACLSLNQT